MKTYSYVTNDNDKKSKKYKNLSHKKKIEDYKYCLEATKLENKIKPTRKK